MNKENKPSNIDVARNRSKYFTFDALRNYNGTLKSEKSYDYLRGVKVTRSEHKFVSNIGFCNRCSIEYGCTGCQTNQFEFDCGVGLCFSKYPDNPTFTGSTYKERCDEQLKQWVEGNPIHNNIDDECCPDFSCCNIELLAAKETRYEFLNADDESRLTILFQMIGNLIDATDFSEDTNVFIGNGVDELENICKINAIEQEQKLLNDFNLN